MEREQNCSNEAAHFPLNLYEVVLVSSWFECDYRDGKMIYYFYIKIDNILIFTGDVKQHTLNDWPTRSVQKVLPGTGNYTSR